MLGVRAAFILRVKPGGNLLHATSFYRFDGSVVEVLLQIWPVGGNPAPRTPLKVVSGTPKGAQDQKNHLFGDPFWKHFTIIFNVFFVRFFDALQDGHFPDMGAKQGPKRVLSGSVFTTFWGQAEHVKIVLSCGFWLGSEGWRLSQIDVFSELFRVCL